MFPVLCAGKVAATKMARLQSVIIIVQSRCSRFVYIGHRAQPLRGFAMDESLRDAATAASVV